MKRLLGLVLFVSVAFAGEAPQAPSVTKDDDLGTRPGDFALYASPIGYKVTVKWRGTLVSELAVPPGVLLEIRARGEGNPELPKSDPIVVHGKVLIRLKVDQGEEGLSREIMKGAPWELKVDDAEVRIVATGKRVTPLDGRLTSR